MIRLAFLTSYSGLVLLYCILLYRSLPNPVETDKLKEFVFTCTKNEKKCNTAMTLVSFYSNTKGEF